MTCVALTGNADWMAAAARAAATWPPPFAMCDPSDTSTPPSICVRTEGEYSATTGLIGRPRGADAVIVGPGPMEPARFGAWARRTFSCLGDGSSMTEWEPVEKTHTLDVPADDLRASHHARRRLRELLGDEHSKLDDVLLATSELTANAHQHGGGVQSIATYVSPVAVVVEVGDLRPGHLPELRRLPGLTASGRGMAIVDTIADHWGITVLDDRKLVWCEFMLDTPSA